MPPKKTAKGQASQARLLEAAAREFAEKGYHQTKVGDIVRSAQLTQAAFYLYFPSKEAIYTELIRQFQDRLRHLVHEQGARVTPLPKDLVPDQVRCNLQLLYSFFISNLELAKAVYFDSADAETIRRELSRIIMLNLQNNQLAGHVSSTLQIDVAAESMVGIVDRVTRRWLLTGEKEPEELAAATAEMILRGILSP